MGTTYSVSKLAASIGDPGDGRVYYALFEKTYESNVFPRTPRWSAIHFGTPESCMQLIIAVSGDCEGGALKGSRGKVTASAYIRQWRNQLKHAASLRPRARIEFGDGFYQVPGSMRPRVDAILHEHGQELPADTTLELDLAKPGACAALAALIALPKDSGRIPAWKALDVADTVAGTGTPYDPSAAPATLDPAVQVYRLPRRHGTGESDLDYVIKLDGTVRVAGWAYAAMQAFIQSHALAAESRIPGCAEELIADFRARLTEAPELSERTGISLTREAPGATNVHSQFFAQIAAALGAAHGDPAIETTVGSLAQRDMLWRVKYLAPAAVAFKRLYATNRQRDAAAAR